MNKVIKSWLVPLLIALGLFAIARPLLAQTLTQEEQLSQLLAGGNVSVGSEMGKNGFRQIYFQIGTNKAFVTNSDHVNADSLIDGEQMVWISKINGSWQIFLHDIPTNNTTQLSFSGNNVNPRIDNGNVVWEGWIDNTWQIFFFDGKSVQQLTTGDSSMNPEIEGDNIVYGRKDVSGTWRAVVYSIGSDKAQDITTGIAAKHPDLENGKIILGRVNKEGGEEFPLTVDDLFLLDLPPLVSTPTPSPEPIGPETVTEQEIIEELQASPSASLEATFSAVPSPSVAPSATPSTSPSAEPTLAPLSTPLKDTP